MISLQASFIWKLEVINEYIECVIVCIYKDEVYMWEIEDNS